MKRVTFSYFESGEPKVYSITVSDDFGVDERALRRAERAYERANPTHKNVAITGVEAI